jgi:hypothetical protein
MKMTEDEKSVEELEAEYKANLAEKIEAFNAEKAKAEELRLEQEKVALAEAEEAKQLEREEAFTKKLEENFILTPKDNGIPPDDGKNTQTNKPFMDKGFFQQKNGLVQEIPSQVAFHEAFSKLHKFENNRVEYGSPDFLQGKEKSYGFVESDSGCADVITAWSPADVWCDLIWQAAMCGRQLSGVVTLRACDINVGDGLSVQIRAINRSTLTATALGSCQCAVCTSNVFSTYTITLDRLDEYKVLCNIDLWDAGYEIRDAIIQSMADEFIVGIDARIYAALTPLGAGVAGQTEVGDCSFTCEPSFYQATPGVSYSCCSLCANLYREIIQLEATMRGNGYGEDGFYLILHPTVANFLKYKEGISPPPWMYDQIHMDGLKLDRIGNNIKVIEYCGANPCTDAGKNVGGDRLGIVGVLLDPKRAIGEAYGYKPKFMADEDPIECDSWKLIYRTYVGIDLLDSGAIGHIVNP